MTIMKNVISQLIDDFHERKVPEPVPRNTEFSEVKGKADVSFRKSLMSISGNIPNIEMAGVIFSLMRYSGLINGKCS